MMSPDLQRILRIRDYCLEIQKTISRYGNDFQIFDSDGDYQRSIAFSILQIGELAVLFLRHIGKKPAIVSSGALLRGCAIWSPIAMEA